MSTLSALRRSNHTVEIMRGCFYVPTGMEETDWLKFKTVAASKVASYIKHFEADGWTLRSEPVVKRVKMSDTEAKRAVVDSKGTALLVLPADRNLRTDHPWYKPGADMYEVHAYFSKPNPEQPIVFELSDKHLSRLIESGRLPPGYAPAE